MSEEGIPVKRQYIGLGSETDENGHTACGQLVCVCVKRAHIGICHTGTADLLNTKNSFPGKETRRLAMWKRKIVLSLNTGLCAQPLSVKHHSMAHIQVKNIRGEMGWYAHQRGDNIVGSVSGELVGGEGLQWHHKRYTWHSQNPQTALSTCGLTTSVIFLVMLCHRCMNNISPVDNISCRLYTCSITTRTLFFKKLLVVGFDFFFFCSKACFPTLFLFQAHGS